MAFRTAAKPAVQGVTVHLLASDGVTAIAQPEQQHYAALHRHHRRERPVSLHGSVPRRLHRQVRPARGLRFVRTAGCHSATDATDSDADRTTGLTGTYTLIAGQTDNTVDAGLLQIASLGDFVWNDVNGNGIQDGGLEVGVQGVTVELYDSTDTLISTTTTDRNERRLPVRQPRPWRLLRQVHPAVGSTTSSRSRMQHGSDDADSDANRFTGKTIVTTLVSGENDLSWDAGILHPAALGDFVWEDANDDGVQDGRTNAHSGCDRPSARQRRHYRDR